MEVNKFFALKLFTLKLSAFETLPSILLTRPLASQPPHPLFVFAQEHVVVRYHPLGKFGSDWQALIHDRGLEPPARKRVAAPAEEATAAQPDIVPSQAEEAMVAKSDGVPANVSNI